MIVFLFGEDQYRLRERKYFYITKLSKTPCILRRFSLSEDFVPEKLKGFLSTPSLFGEKRAALIEDISLEGFKELKSVFKKLKLDRRGIAIVFSSSVAPPKDFIRIFNREFDIVQEKFAILKKSHFFSFVCQKAEEFGLVLEKNVLKTLAEIYEGDTWGVVTELEKIRNWGKKIAEKDLENLIFPEKVNINNLSNLLISFDLKDRLYAFELINFRRESFSKFFYKLGYFSPFSIAKIADLDKEIKAGKIQYEEAVLDLLLG